MEFESVDEVLEELLELEIVKLFKSVEGVTDVKVYDMTIKESVHGAIIHNKLLLITELFFSKRKHEPVKAKTKKARSFAKIPH